MRRNPDERVRQLRRQYLITEDLYDGRKYVEALFRNGWLREEVYQSLSFLLNKEPPPHETVYIAWCPQTDAVETLTLVDDIDRLGNPDRTVLICRANLNEEFQHPTAVCNETYRFGNMSLPEIRDEILEFQSPNWDDWGSGPLTLGVCPGWQVILNTLGIFATDQDQKRRNPATAKDLEPFFQKVVDSGYLPLDLLPSYDVLRTSILGCGSHGCVYKARRPGWVMKVTSDFEEASLATLVREIKNPRITNGMAVFGGAIQIGPDAHSSWTRESGRLFLIWREEVTMLPHKPAVERALQHLQYYTAWIDEIRFDLFSRVSPEDQAAFRNEIFDLTQTDAYVDAAEDESKNVIEAFDSSFTLDARWAARRILFYEKALLNMKTEFPSIAGILDTMLFLAQLGVYLADIREENVGYVKRAGHLTPVIADAHCFMLEEPNIPLVEIPMGETPQIQRQALMRRIMLDNDQEAEQLLRELEDDGLA